ncbi:MAG: hypothetical protein Q4G68_08140 [Planctomycetia bacterium]|nr:hypothetical protein [Planctomycetia bacterium]
MTDFRRPRLFYLFILFTLWPILDSGTGIGQEKNNEILKIESHPEVDAYMEAHDFASAEKKARELNLDPRVLGTICAYAGKKDEAYRIFLDFIGSVPDETQKEVAFQTVNLLRGASPDLADEFYSYLIDHKVITLSENQLCCEEITSLTRSNNLEEAEAKLNHLFDTSYREDDLISAAILLVARLSTNAQNREKVKGLCEKLLARFPDNPQVKLQWISSLMPLDPQKALVELDVLKKNSPDFCEKHEQMIRFIRGNIFENLDEDERAKAEYESLLNTDFNMAAKDKMNYYNVKDQVEQELEEKVRQVNEKGNDVATLNSNWFWVSLVLNVVLLGLFFFVYYKRRRPVA